MFCLISRLYGHSVHSVIVLRRWKVTTADFYIFIVEGNFRKEINDSLAVAQRPKLTGSASDHNVNERVILFVKMNPDFAFNPQLEISIKKTIRSLLSPRHVPDIILEVEDIPVSLMRCV